MIYGFYLIEIKNSEKTDNTFQLYIKVSVKMVSNLLIVDTIQEFIAADLRITTLKNFIRIMKN